MLWHAYVDESGDRGWKPRPPALALGHRGGSSLTFSLTALLLPDGQQTAVLQAWDVAAQQIGRRLGHVIHWTNVKSHGQRKHLISVVSGVPDVQTISVMLCKWHLKNATALRDPDYLYGWTLRLLLERLSWFGEKRGVEVVPTFSQVTGLPAQKLHRYVATLQIRDTQIAWKHLLLPIRVDTPKNKRMLQFADTASGAVHAAFHPDDFGFTEQGYLEILKPAIWRRPGRPMWKDGLKYGPWPDADCAQEHPWFEEFSR